MSKTWLRLVSVIPLLAAALCAQDFTVFRAPGESPREQLVHYLNAVGQKQLQQRDREIAQIKTREDAERRKKVVRERILRLIGGLPSFKGPLNTKQLGVLDRGDYRIEKIIYESLPGFYVPANVYVPARGSGPFPAILMPVGHSVGGKEGERETAVGLARKGFIALKYDPIGQGERLQYYDPDLRASKVGGPTEEHSHAGGHTTLIGDNVARYRIWDGMRGIDYLLTRKDVDPNRIGCTGCSGGGTITTYISALDDRVKVAAPACYINSWQELLEKLGPQDGEQSFPRFLSEGLNIADYVELFAPKPWLSASTIQDFFPLEGARQTFEESKRFYSLYGAEDRVQWFVGPGGHGVPKQSREAIYAWFIKWLKNGDGDPQESPAKLDNPEDLLCTPTGQVSDSLGGETVFTLNKKRAAEVIPPKQPVSSAADLDRLRARLAGDIKALASITVEPGGAPPPLTLHRTVERGNYKIDVVSFESERGIHIPGLIFVPESGGPKPAVLVVDPRPKEVIAAPGGDLESLVKSGRIVFALQPRGIPETERPGRASLLGDYAEPLRAAVVGKTLVGMRAEDIIRGVDYLSSRPDVDRRQIAALGEGGLGVPLLHAAVLDSRISRLIFEETLMSYRTAVDRPIHRNLYEVAIPGVLRRYDLDDLLLALGPRPVTILNPVDALGRSVLLRDHRQQLKYVLDSDRNLGKPDRLQVVFRGRGEPLSQFLESRVAIASSR